MIASQVDGAASADEVLAAAEVTINKIKKGQNVNAFYIFYIV